ARIAPAASAQATSAVKNQRQKVSASGGSQPAARRATRMLAANIAGATNSRAHAPAGVLMPELGQGRPKSVLGPFRYCGKSIGRPLVAHATPLSRAAARRAARAVPLCIAHRGRGRELAAASAGFAGTVAALAEIIHGVIHCGSFVRWCGWLGSTDIAYPTDALCP